MNCGDNSGTYCGYNNEDELKTIAKALLITTFSSAMLMSAAHANNPPPAIKADAPNRYIVKKAIRCGTSQDVI